MTTIAQVIDRIYRDYLTPPGEQPTRFQVGVGGIDNSSVTLPVDVSMLAVEESGAIDAGTLLEVISPSTGGELVLVEATSGDPLTSLTVRRSMYDTTAAAHAAGDFIYLCGDKYVPRSTVFDAVADAIGMLYPALYRIAVEETVVTSVPIELPSAAKEVVDVRYYNSHRWLPVSGWDEIHGFPHVSTSRALQVRRLPANTLIQVYYKQAPTRPTAESDVLDDLGVDEAWAKVVKVGAVAEVAARFDLEEATVDYITESLEAEQFDAGETTDIRNALLQYQEFLMRPLIRALRIEHRGRIKIRRGP